MKRPVVIIVGAAAGALLIAAIGASAHTGLSLTKSLGVHSSALGEEATGARTESPEPTDTPEAPPTAEPTETTEPADTETDTDTETDDDTGGAAPVKTTETSSSDEHDGGGSGDGEQKSDSGD